MAKSPRDLVCTRCWTEFFDTQSFEECCTCPPESRGYHGQGTTEAKWTVQDVRVAASAGCGWCAHIETFLASEDELQGDCVVTVSLSPTSIRSTTPQGANIFYLAIGCTTSTGKSAGSWALFLHAFTDAGDDAAEYVTARPLRTDVGGQHAASQIKIWLGECDENHQCREQRSDSPLPRRVIEVSPSGGQQPRIIESNGRRGSYAALSYCWGKQPFLSLTCNNYRQLMDGLDMSLVSPTIRDAVLVTQSMAIPYLWVDALCIIQDSEDDKTSQIASMSDIYASSTVTVVAASAESASQGFLSPRTDSETVYTIPVRLGPHIFGSMSINELDAACYDERSEPIAKRAWTMQEQVLAPRTVAFATHTMIWSCKAGARAYGDALHFPHDLDAGYNDNDEKYSLNLRSLLLTREEAQNNKDKALACWLRLITAYSLRRASLERDKLNAVAGIASHDAFSSALGLYHAGMWEYDLARQLIWRTGQSHRTLGPNEIFVFRRPSEWRAPSWSWASLDGGIIYFELSYDDDDEPKMDVLCDIVECETTHKYPDRNPFGEVTAAHLVLRAAMRKAWFDPATSSVIFLLDERPGDFCISFEEAWNGHVRAFMERYPETDLAEDPEYVHGTDGRNTRGSSDESDITAPLLVYCLAVTLAPKVERGVQGLLLVSKETSSRGLLYQRVGFFETAALEDFREVEKREITVI